jgi:hypothetical protein
VIYELAVGLNKLEGAAELELVRSLQPVEVITDEWNGDAALLRALSSVWT